MQEDLDGSPVSRLSSIHNRDKKRAKEIFRINDAKRVGKKSFQIELHANENM